MFEKEYLTGEGDTIGRAKVTRVEFCPHLFCVLVHKRYVRD